MKIEKGIPIPKANGESKWREVLIQMEIGDSIIVPQSTRANVQRVARDVGCRLTARQMDSQNCRLWMVEKKL